MTTAANPRPRKSPLPKLIAKYYADMADLSHQNVMYEGGTRWPFHALLAAAGKDHHWTLIAEHEKKIAGKTIRPDGTFKDAMNLVRGYWEAKDTADNLDVEIEKKRKAGYPLTNIIFEDTATAILYQHGQELLRADMADPAKLADLVTQFFSYVEPEIEEFEHAVDEFKLRVPDLADGLRKKIDQSHKTNPAFKKAFADFFELCRTSLNPNLSPAAVDEMLIQHILTERLIREIFDNPEFVRRNVIAAEVEKVMLAMTSQSFDRHSYLRELDRFYIAIEAAARTMTDWSDKQYFLNTVYERFFQGYSTKLADTMGIVYTPQEIVDFMCASVAEVLDKEFGKKLWSDDVFIIDPCTGTGNFIVNLIRRIPKAKLESVYKHRLFANEIMLLPYYIAALNIEHAYFEQTGTYEAFEGLCFVDTLDLAEHRQGELGFMTAKNSERVERQRKSPITVVIGNPPYNIGQVDENDNNKNRKYPVIDSRIRDTFAKDSRATNKRALGDAYVKFFRWAIDRLERRDGIVCFVSNNNFVDQIALDGFRQNLLAEFTAVYHVDLHGNVRRNPKLSGTTHNVFGIQVGVGITVAVRRAGAAQSAHRLLYARAEEYWRRERKLDWLAALKNVGDVPWRELTPDATGNWLHTSTRDEFGTFAAIGSKAVKAGPPSSAGAIFHTFSGGAKTNRDDVVFDFAQQPLVARIRAFIDEYNGEVDRYRRAGNPEDIDEFVRYGRLKWSRDLKADLRRGNYASFSERNVHRSMYRPFVTRWLFLDGILNEEVYVLPRIFPDARLDGENPVICVPGLGNRQQFGCFVTSIPPALDFAFEKGQVFPFYTYDEDGTNRRENITDWALAQFRSHYRDDSIDKWAIFHYVYGLLHHPGYRAKFADNLKRELPRIPFAPNPQSGVPGARLSPAASSCSYSIAPNAGEDTRAPARNTGGDAPAPGGNAGGDTRAPGGFWAFARAGRALAELHLNYETLEPFNLEFIETPGLPLSYRVADKMRLSKDKTRLTVNPSLTLAGIPPEAFTYRLGNRSALEWVIDQYQVSTDARSGITSDPNRDDDPQYITRLVGQVIRVSLETMSIVNGLPEEFAEG